MHNHVHYSIVFFLGLVSFITCFVAEFKRTKIVGNLVVFRNHRTRIKREDDYKINNLTLPTVLLILSWSNFVVVVLVLSTAISMSREQPFAEGWFEEDCYLVKDGVFAASGCLAILGLGALTISAIKIKVKKQQQQLVAVVIKDQDQKQTKSEERKQNHDDHQMNKSENVIYFVEEAPSTADDRI
ncbi:hypothetical protein Bca4012_023593 [Brassica carinata]